MNKMKRKIKAVMALCLVLSIGLIVGCDKTGKGYEGNCPQYGCRLTTKEANFESKVLDDSGNGCLTDCNADIYVKNIENQPGRVYIKADCYTVNQRATYSSETYWMQPQEEHTFKIKVDTGMTENWKCENFEIHSEQISDCEIYQIN